MKKLLHLKAFFDDKSFLLLKLTTLLVYLFFLENFANKVSGWIRFQPGFLYLTVQQKVSGWAGVNGCAGLTVQPSNKETDRFSLWNFSNKVSWWIRFQSRFLYQTVQQKVSVWIVVNGLTVQPSNKETKRFSLWNFANEVSGWIRFQSVFLYLMVYQKFSV